MKTVTMQTVRVRSRGSDEREIRVTGADGNVLCARWSGGAPCEFSLSHGAILASPQWTWNWSLHPEDLDALRAELKVSKPKVPPPDRRPRMGREAIAESRNTRQLDMWGGRSGG